MSCASRAASAGISPIEAESAIAQAMTRPPSPSTEVGTAIRKAYAEFGWGRIAANFNPRSVAGIKPKTLPMTAQAFVRKGDGADESAWWETSPVRIDGEPGPNDALALIDALYPRDANLFCGERYGTTVRAAGEWRDRFARGEPLPPHIIPNPLCGREVPNPKDDGKPSARCDEAVVGFRYATAEFDGMDKADQLAFWWGFASAPIVALIDSGGKSIHAWLRVDCSDRATWEREVEGTLFGKVLIPLGCDPQCRNEARLSRLPGHFRREKNAWQRLLYLNPEGGRR
ncbi:MAG TPA: hypothetical protein PLZ95_12985 [Bryobacteraceae bacterium]|nr:hypothetical protein [Bryobacteraceae bacterium]